MSRIQILNRQLTNTHQDQEHQSFLTDLQPTTANVIRGGRRAWAVSGSNGSEAYASYGPYSAYASYVNGRYTYSYTY